MAKNTNKIITARAKAFANAPIGTYRFSVDPDGTVRVWDSVARHFTLCHSLNARAQRRILNLALAL